MRLKCLQRYDFRIIDFACSNAAVIFLFFLFLSFIGRGAWTYFTQPVMLFHDWALLIGGALGALWALGHMIGTALLRKKRVRALRAMPDTFGARTMDGSGTEVRFKNNPDAHNDVCDPKA